MIYDEPMPGERDPYNRIGTRGVVTCDEPGCDTSFYIPHMGAYNAAARMRKLGWEVDGDLEYAPNGQLVPIPVAVKYASRCPEHVRVDHDAT